MFLPSLSVFVAVVAAMMVTKITAATAMVGGIDNNQIIATAEEMAAVAVTARARERGTATATGRCQQGCINDSNDDDAIGKCLWQGLRQLWRQRWWQWRQ